MTNRRILIVEDNEELRRLYKEVLSANGFEVIEATDGQEAIDLALIQRPALVLLDLMLPRQGGLGVLRVMRSLPELKLMPVIVLTALPNPEYRAQAEGRVQGYFLKTEIKPGKLVEKARELLKE